MTRGSRRLCSRRLSRPRPGSQLRSCPLIRLALFCTTLCLSVSQLGPVAREALAGIATVPADEQASVPASKALPNLCALLTSTPDLPATARGDSGGRPQGGNRADAPFARWLTPGTAKLPDGTLLALTDVFHKPSGTLAAAQTAGAHISYTPLGASSDRHRRQPAYIFSKPEGSEATARWLQADRIAARTAWLDPDPMILPGPELRAQRKRCLEHLLELETGDRPPLLSATDTTTAAAASGQLRRIHGRIVSIGRRDAGTYINFSRDWKRSVSVFIPRDLILAWPDWHAELLKLTAQPIEVRGWIEQRRTGISIRLSHPVSLRSKAPSDLPNGPKPSGTKADSPRPDSREPSSREPDSQQ